jgi:hypothetical protein
VGELGPWEPLSPDGVEAVLSDASFAWWLGGGWSLDLLIGAQTREHHDIDVVVLRPDLARVRAHFAAWDLHVADPPGTGALRPWFPGAPLRADLHDVWCRRGASEPWCLQVMVDDVDGSEWVYRRDRRIRRPVAGLSGRASRSGRSALAPEIQLLYKSTSLREKDQVDFDRVVPLLVAEDRDWLSSALALSSPGHMWLERLADGPAGS